MIAPARPIIDVCVCTYRRPELLAKLLDSIAAQETDDAFDIRVHVADNDPGASARPIVDAFARRHPIPLRYVVQPVPNIALTRNASLEGARGDYVAFIDDDEHASPRWLLSHLRAIETSGADGLCGPVERYFEDGIGRFYIASGVFDQPNPPDGADEFVFMAGNAFIRRALLDELGRWFDPAFGVIGGEDTELFWRARFVAGKRLLWCRTALVHEFVPRERARLRWLLARHFRIGISTSALVDHFGGDLARAGRPRRRPGVVALKLFRVAMALAAAPCDPSRLAKPVIQAAYLAGRVAYLAGVRPGDRLTSELSALGSRR